MTCLRQTLSLNQGFQPKTLSPALLGKDPACCFIYSSTKHFANIYPNKATIKEILIKEDKDIAKKEKEYYKSKEV